MTYLFRIYILLANALLTGCVGLPKNVSPIDTFDLERYLGKWYEIARLDHSFERGMSQVSAEYTRRDDGGVSVINRGYLDDDKVWKQAEGKAYFVADEATGHLKVSFFGPFYSSYVIFELDEEHYQYAFVSGPSTDDLWLLSRTPNVEQSLIEHFKKQAIQAGFDISSLILVDQNAQN